METSCLVHVAQDCAAFLGDDVHKKGLKARRMNSVTGDALYCMSS